MTDGLAIIAEALSEQAGVEITLEKAAGMVTTTGRDAFIYTTLDPATEYCVVAVGLDSKARQTTGSTSRNPSGRSPRAAAPPIRWSARSRSTA